MQSFEIIFVVHDLQVKNGQKHKKKNVIQFLYKLFVSAINQFFFFYLISLIVGLAIENAVLIALKVVINLTE